MSDAIKPTFTLDERTKIDDFKSGVYRHYKGQMYLVLGVALDVSNGEPIKAMDNVSVVYVPLYEPVGMLRMYHRLFEEFNGMVFVGGVPRKRFAHCGNGAFL